jgi:hypothetical protein
MSKLVPLRLNDLIFPTISVSALPVKPEEHAKAEHSREIDPETLAFSFRFVVEDDGHNATAGLRIRSKDSAPGAGAPYRIDVEAFAVFEVNGHEHTDDGALRMRRYSAAAALLGAIREQVATLTSRGPWGTAWIPVVSIEAMADVPKPATVAPSIKGSDPVKKARPKKASTKPKTS